MFTVSPENPYSLLVQKTHQNGAFRRNHQNGAFWRNHQNCALFPYNNWEDFSKKCTALLVSPPEIMGFSGLPVNVYVFFFCELSIPNGEFKILRFTSISATIVGYITTQK